MGIFSRHLKPSHPVETIQPGRIEFIGEQTGAVEDDLKAKFREAFIEAPAVRSAYLAQLSYGEAGGHSVALCIRSSVGEDRALQNRVGEIFTDTFAGDQYLDILFIRDDQEEELKKVCRPFYEAV